MEKKKLSVLKTRNSEFERYRSNTKSLFLRVYGGALVWIGQHENATTLEKTAISYAKSSGCPVEFELRTGHGILVESGTIYQS